MEEESVWVLELESAVDQGYHRLRHRRLRGRGMRILGQGPARRVSPFHLLGIHPDDLLRKGIVAVAVDVPIPSVDSQPGEACLEQGTQDEVAGP